jgi:type IV pilus assembly protein PilN
MRDLNFFEPYIEKRELKFNKMILLYMLLALAIAGVAGLGVYNQMKINLLEAQAKTLRYTAQEPKKVEKYNEIKELENEMKVFKEEVDKIIKMDKSIAQADIINVGLLSKIKTKMPEDLFLTNLNVDGRDMKISGVAKDSNSIAEFSKGLRTIEDVESVFISIINNVDGNYSFVLNTTFKDVSIDEQ